MGQLLTPHGKDAMSNEGTGDGRVVTDQNLIFVTLGFVRGDRAWNLMLRLAWIHQELKPAA